jgi:hypothetical protein
MSSISARHRLVIGDNGMVRRRLESRFVPAAPCATGSQIAGGAELVFSGDNKVYALHIS